MSGNSRYVFTLDEAAREYCERNLNETEETRQKALDSLRKWSRDNARLHVKSDDRSLLCFLRGCKFNLERTQGKLRNYYELRRDAPEWFANRDPLDTKIQELTKLGVFVPLLKPVDRQLVVIIRTAAHDPAKYKQDDVFKTGKMLLDIACEENEEAQIFGVIAIFDMQGVSFSHGRQLTPKMIKKAVFAWQNYHCRPKRLDFVQAPTYINVLLTIFKSFMSDKLKSRVTVHFGGLEGLEHIPRDVLPEEYGGTGGKLETLLEYWSKKLIDYQQWFKADELFKADKK